MRSEIDLSVGGNPFYQFTDPLHATYAQMIFNQFKIPYTVVIGNVKGRVAERYYVEKKDDNWYVEKRDSYVRALSGLDGDFLLAGFEAALAMSESLYRPDLKLDQRIEKDVQWLIDNLDQHFKTLQMKEFKELYAQALERLRGDSLATVGLYPIPIVIRVMKRICANRYFSLSLK